MAVWSSDTFLFLQCRDRFWCNMSNWIWRILQWICIWSWGQYNPPSPPTKGWNWPFGRIVKQLPHTRPRTCSKPTKQFAKCLKCFTIMTKKTIDNLLNANPINRIALFVDGLHFLPNLTPSHLICEPMLWHLYGTQVNTPFWVDKALVTEILSSFEGSHCIGQNQKGES